MNKDNIKTEIVVKEQKIKVLVVDGKEYISLTDLARYADSEEPRLPIRDWMRNKDVISYLGLWESINNENFKGGEFALFKNDAGSNTFKMSPQKWIKETNAVGIISKSDSWKQRYYIDLLFYHLKLKAYVVVELKATEFKPEYIGKMNFYLSAVDDLVKDKSDNPTIGLILCKNKDKFSAQYSLKDINKPIGVSSFKLKEYLFTEEELNIHIDFENKKS